MTTIETIQVFTADFFGLDAADMRAPGRARKVARPRQIAMTLCRQLTNRSLPEIGRQFGGRDHTTVLHAVRRVEALTAEYPDIRRDVDMIRARITALRPKLSTFNLISLGEWLGLARKMNVPHVPARFVCDARVEDLRHAEIEGDIERNDRLQAFFRMVYGVRLAGEMLRWDCCAPDGVKLAMSRGAHMKPPVHVITVDEPRFNDILNDDLPPSQTAMPVWRRPWIQPRVENGYPVEYRAFVLNGKVIGVSNYYPQSVLRSCPKVDHEIELVKTYAKAMIAAQLLPLANPQIIDAGLDPTAMHCTMDFIATPNGILFLEGGPPALEKWGAHPCCFEGRPIDGIAYGPLHRSAA